MFTMSYQDSVRDLAKDAEQLEQVYQVAQQVGETAAFQQAIDANHEAAPDNLLFAAWFYRLQQSAAQAKGFAVAWAWILPLALVNGLLFWWFSDDQQFMMQIAGTGRTLPQSFLPAVFLWAAPLSAALVLIYLTAVGQKQWQFSVPIGLLMLAAGAYVYWMYPQAGTRPFQEQYLMLMLLHLPLLAWAGVGAFLVVNHRDPANRFAFLIKSLEVFIMGGLFVMAGGLFVGITFGLFDALSINFSEVVQRLFIAGGAGLIPVAAVAIIYNPKVAPAKQAFGEGVNKLIALLLRILLPFTLLVLLVYLGFIPFNFREPFDNRDVLVIYNGMLFAVIALLVGATPMNLDELSPRLARWLRWGIVAVAALAFIISLYALAAILYRTAIDRLTPNRLTFIGWNVVNIGLLFLLLLYQMRGKAAQWLPQLYRAYSAGTVAYAIWTVAMILLIPWLFGIDQGEIEVLPVRVQELVYDEPNPILLKCLTSPHIYVLERGEKRWIQDIETFNDRGYVWRDVHIISCDELGAVPDGATIPLNAGPPPQP
jgi:hypothetical protein